ncbi:DUF805 domain-containing protein [Croceibacterium sp. LX-88]|jgi:uncharacterized membrane protein YhaH (DUF805 family)|uniref:DUF805 domain-containing protein n=1 Tax=Croceibacterium selenioxidans TaxID=2838833 RepID=A0ABS5W9H4_9SPHN|nr:DUF805 domain-containing protein [Croceibacterium selenioxidans]MBT2135870.1 DUF805 domain-containing protein [Croceibacterium selenioxidans]
MKWMLLPFRRYAEFSGRSRRMEFWMFQLLGLIVGVVLYSLILAGGGMEWITMVAATAEGSVVDNQLEGFSFGPLAWVGIVGLLVWFVAAFIPSLAVTVRRLHDRDMSGWYLPGFIVAVICLSLIPILGAILVLVLEIGWIVLMALPGTQGSNKYGADPLGQADAEVFA